MASNTLAQTIAIPANEPETEAMVANRFARAPFYAIYHHDSLEFTFVKNQAMSATGHTGVNAAKQLVDLSVDVVLVPDIGAKAFQVFHKANIPVHRYHKDYSIRDVLYEYYEGKIGELAHHTDPHTFD